MFEELPLEIKLHICELLIEGDERRNYYQPGQCREVHTLSRDWRQAALIATTGLRLDPSRLCLPDHRDMLVRFRNLARVQLNLQGCDPIHPAFAWLAFVPLLTNLEVLEAIDSNLHFLDRLTGLTRLSLGSRRHYSPMQWVSQLPAFSNGNSLRTLELVGTKVQDLTPLSRLGRLEELDISFTGVTSLAPLKGLTGLRCLRMHEMSEDLLTDQYLTTLSDMHTLRELRAWFSRADWTPVTALTGLTLLSIGNSQTSAGLLSLSSMTSLRSLSVEGWQPQPDIAALTCLTYLDVEGTGLTDVQHLAGLRSLVKLKVGRNSVTDLSPLSNLACLQMLCLHGNQVPDLRPLQRVRSLHTIYETRLRQTAMQQLKAVHFAKGCMGDVDGFDE